MKKTVSFIITVIMLFSLVACGDQTNQYIPERDDSQQSEFIQNNATAGNNAQVEKQINVASGFSNDMAFVQYAGDENTYCIDKTGKQLFELENCNIYNFAKFNGTVAMIEKSGLAGYFLCDITGKIFEAQDLGASRIVLDTDNHKQAFLDGYIILERKEESFTGTTVEMSIIDSNFSTLVPFSVDLAEKINSDAMSVRGTNYYDGYLYFDDDILDLRTGKQLTSRTQMNVATPLLSYWANGSYGSNFEHLEWGDIYNQLTGEVIANISENETISYINFVGETGLAVFGTNNGYWFTVVDSKGNFNFDPIKLYSKDGLQFDGNIILTRELATEEQNGKQVQVVILRTYDASGKILGERKFELEKSWSGVAAQLSDGVINVSANTIPSFYKENMEPLF